MTTLEIFVWGFGGSFAVEVVEFSKVYYAQDYSPPYRYRLWHFYVLRLLLAAIGGGLAIAYKIDQALLAANIGAATPLLIEALTRNFAKDVASQPSAVSLPQQVAASPPPPPSSAALPGLAVATPAETPKVSTGGT